MSLNLEILWYKFAQIPGAGMDVIHLAAFLATEMVMMLVLKLEPGIFAGKLNHPKVFLGNECLKRPVHSGKPKGGYLQLCCFQDFIGEQRSVCLKQYLTYGTSLPR